MSFIKTPLLASSLLSALLVAPLSASAATLSLPDAATVGVEVVDAISFTDGQSRQEGILLRPADISQASHTLPEYCVIVGDAQRDDARVRITTHDVTCIETDEADSSIFSGEIDAAVYGDDGQYGVSCNDASCELASGHAFTLTLNAPLEITERDNPSARINETRRQTDGEGVANPIPADRPDPDAASPEANSPDANDE